MSDKIQSKIWANEYIDLGNLLQIASSNQSQYNFVVQTPHSSDRPVISLKPAQKPKRIATIDQWISAFQTFVAIYTVRSPTDAPALMKYSETVRDLAAKNAHWRYFDENFRFLRQKTLFPWDQMDWELWLQAHRMQKSPTVVSPDSRSRPTRSSFPCGFCWRFHRGEKCSGCNFKHECFGCGSHHPANQLHFPKQQANSTKAVSRPKSTAVNASNSAPTFRLSRPLATPIKIDKLPAYLEGYPPRPRQYLIAGFRFGFSIDYVGHRSNFVSKNLLSATTNPKAVGEKLAKQIQLGRIVGPFDVQPFPVFHVSPLGLIPKKVTGRFRLIHHLSFPEGKSINSHIPQIASSVHYANIDDAIRLIWRTGRGCALAKTDIKNAFRLIPVSPSDYNLLGICWRDRFYVDRNLAMGLSSSCKIFECFSSALEWIARFRLHIPGILHLLDDFLIVSKSLASCANDLQVFLKTCDELGVPMAPEKTVGPSLVLSFAGIELHTQNMEARLPSDKRTKCRDSIQHFLRRKKITLREQ